MEVKLAKLPRGCRILSFAFDESNGARVSLSGIRSRSSLNSFASDVESDGWRGRRRRQLERSFDTRVRSFIHDGLCSQHGRRSQFSRSVPYASRTYATAAATAFAKPSTSGFVASLPGSELLEDQETRSKPRVLSQAQKEWLYDEGMHPGSVVEEITDRPSRFDWRKRATSRLDESKAQVLHYTRRKDPDDKIASRGDFAGKIERYKEQ